MLNPSMLSWPLKLHFVRISRLSLITSHIHRMYIGVFDISVPRSFSLFPLYFDPSLFVCFFNNHTHYNILQYGKKGAFGTAEKSPWRGRAEYRSFSATPLLRDVDGWRLHLGWDSEQLLLLSNAWGAVREDAPEMEKTVTGKRLPSAGFPLWIIQATWRYSQRCAWGVRQRPKPKR